MCDTFLVCVTEDEIKTPRISRGVGFMMCFGLCLGGGNSHAVAATWQNLLDIHAGKVIRCSN